MKQSDAERVADLVMLQKHLRGWIAIFEKAEEAFVGFSEVFTAATPDIDDVAEAYDGELIVPRATAVTMLTAADAECIAALQKLGVKADG